ncbi:DUF3987 domain-containing protein [Pectobacterium sp. CHL-2024]|uniref:DUF3987 domain-containing protein n=1 Tax=Pectobacterium sp. CHL-2024 TaxID=3377079 RepID=UPI0037FA2189
MNMDQPQGLFSYALSIPKLQFSRPLPPPPYPIAAFPPILKGVMYTLHYEHQVPIELIANVVLAAASLACQSHIEVIPPYSNIPEKCSLYLLTIAESGEGKTTINKRVMKPFYDFSSELKQEYESRLTNYKRDLRLWKVKQQALDSNLRQAIKRGYLGEIETLRIEEHAKLEPLRPARPNIIYEDTSLKALVEGLNEYPEAGFISDEAITFFKGYLKNNPGLLNKAWDGEMFDFRRADGEIYQIKPCLTFSLMAQPTIFINYLKKMKAWLGGVDFFPVFYFLLLIVQSGIETLRPFMIKHMMIWSYYIREYTNCWKDRKCVF